MVADREGGAVRPAHEATVDAVALVEAHGEALEDERDRLARRRHRSGELVEQPRGTPVPGRRRYDVGKCQVSPVVGSSMASMEPSKAMTATVVSPGELSCDEAWDQVVPFRVQVSFTALPL